MARFTVDSDRSTITVLARPRLAPDERPIPATVSGVVDVADDGTVTGSLVVTLEADPAGGTTPPVSIDLDRTSLARRSGPADETVIEGRIDRAAAQFGRTGSPLVNPTIQLRWRLTLLPA
jgi:hypothetical protein